MSKDVVPVELAVTKADELAVTKADELAVVHGSEAEEKKMLVFCNKQEDVDESDIPEWMVVL